MMQDVKLSPTQQAIIIEHHNNPQSRLNERALQKFNKTADDAAKERMSKALSRQ